MNNKTKHKHTPGPWRASGTGNHQGLIISEATGENIAVVYDGEANAHLIAAAPELLKVAKYVDLVYAEYMSQRPDPMSEGFEFIQRLVGEARAIIAKAEGSA